MNKSQIDIIFNVWENPKSSRYIHIKAVGFMKFLKIFMNIHEFFFTDILVFFLFTCEVYATLKTHREYTDTFLKYIFDTCQKTPNNEHIIVIFFLYRFIILLFLRVQNTYVHIYCIHRFEYKYSLCIIDISG